MIRVYFISSWFISYSSHLFPGESGESKILFDRNKLASASAVWDKMKNWLAHSQLHVYSLVLVDYSGGISRIDPRNQIQLHINFCNNTVQWTLSLSNSIHPNFKRYSTCTVYVHGHVTSCLWLSVLYTDVFWLPWSSTSLQGSFLC